MEKKPIIKRADLEKEIERVKTKLDLPWLYLHSHSPVDRKRNAVASILGECNVMGVRYKIVIGDFPFQSIDHLEQVVATKINQVRQMAESKLSLPETRKRIMHGIEDLDRS